MTRRTHLPTTPRAASVAVALAAAFGLRGPVANADRPFALAWCPAPVAMLVAPASLPVSDGELVLGARAAWAEGDLVHARALLEEAAVRQPAVADHVAVMLGEIELEAGDPAAARTRFESALESTSPNVRLEARVGRVRALIDLGARDADRALAELMREYPELPEAERLELASATALEREGRLEAAVGAYVRIDLDYPGAREAEEARARLASLLEGGVEVPSYTLAQRVARASRLTSTGPMPSARIVVDDLLADPSLEGNARRTVLRLAIRIARTEGRFTDVDTFERALRESATKAAAPTPIDAPLDAVPAPAAGSGDAGRTTPAPTADSAPEATADAAAAAEGTQDEADAEAVEGELPEGPRDPRLVEADTRARRARTAMARILRGRSLANAPLDRLPELADHAAGGGLDDALTALIGRARSPDASAAARFGVAIAATARPGFDDAALALLAELGDPPPELVTGARYHRARILERRGDLEAAQALYRSILDADRSSGRYYTLWTRQRLAAAEGALAARAAVPTAEALAASPDAGVAQVADAGTPANRTVRAVRGVRGGRTFELSSGGAAEASPTPDAATLDALAAQLDAPAAALDRTYPYLARAAALLRLRAVEEARTELFEALVAHRLAAGRGVHRYGLEAVSRGVSRAAPPTRASARGRSGSRRAPRVTRRPLDEATRDIIADVAATLGDHGTAIALGSQHSADDRPRAFEVEVLAAARHHDVDPNLLWAVMRVESVYQPRIVSYAGAVGLMQIMPRTGRLIAAQLGRSHFTTAQLLDPATNVDFAAWYLRSLIDRFDGSVPLAVAAYNGGPHNVRVWLERSGPGMPLDAFLERIPFDQTHRYVRRVLTHYAAYRTRDGQAMIDLGVGVPPPRLDGVAF